MSKKFLIVIILILILLLPKINFSKEDLLSGTEFTDGLTDKQLAIQRWFSNLTYLNKEDRWKGWYYEPKQLGLTSLRYHLGFMGYACAAMCAKTPAYREVASAQLDDIIQRMIDKRVWDFVEAYWKRKPFYPDPVYFENIMYSGHLGQLIGLYEAISGDYKYTTEGFDFVWNENTKIHYTSELLQKRFHQQMDENDFGGIPCEPKIVFVYCNDHQQNSMLLFDKIHGTNYSEISEKWREWMEENSVLSEHMDEFFKVSYFTDARLWLPVGVPGGDAWGLAWMYPWTNNPDFVKKGWEKLKNNKKWKSADAKQEFLPPLGFGCEMKMDEMKEEKGEKCHTEHLPPSSLDRMGGVTLGMSSCFVPMVARQVEGKDSEKAKKVFAWYEKNFGRWDDFDGDGYKESFYYDTDFSDRIEVTGNLACAMVTHLDSFRNIVRNPHTKEFFEKPYLTHIDYPNVYLRKAEYKDGKLYFTVLKGTPSFKGNTNLICKNLSSVSKVIRNGKQWNNYQFKDGVLTIETDIKKEYEFVVK